MCGIAGAVALKPGATVDTNRIHCMSAAIAHRGPDGDGIYAPTSGVCLAHRRLSVIDLATGQQPMITPGGTAISFNGEIYNYVELRDELRQRGVVCRTASDTEVILHLYEALGPAMLPQLRGMYALAIWDPKREQVVLARDPVGKKPLYYAEADGCLYFASTFNAVRTALGGTSRINLPMVDVYLSLGYVPAPESIDARIRKLEAGTTVIAGPGGVNEARFWDWSNGLETFSGSRDEAVEQLDQMISTAVTMRLRSDVPLGVLLSGGIDSSLVAAVATRVSSTPIHTFSIGFDVPGYDERGYAAEVARRIGSQHYSFVVHHTGLALLPELTRHYGEPFGDSSAIPSWHLAKETRQHVTVALGGDGGDEGFGGYNWYRTAETFRRLSSPPLAALARAGAGVLSSSSGRTRWLGRAYRAFLVLGLEEHERYAALRSFMGEDEAGRLYAGALAETAALAGFRGRRLLTSVFAATSGSSLQRMRCVDVKTYLADCLMPKMDVASMAHALEVRAPLLDHHVLRFALSLPDHLVTRDGQGKSVLRDLLARYLPSELFNRRKQGFTLPLADWFKRELLSAVKGLPHSEPLIATGWFRPDGVKALIDEHINGHRDHTQRLYNLLALEEWLRQN